MTTALGWGYAPGTADHPDAPWNQLDAIEPPTEYVYLDLYGGVFYLDGGTLYFADTYGDPNLPPDWEHASPVEVNEDPDFVERITACLHLLYRNHA